jgi:SAM-dependent methyltransferase/acyl carrier protein
MACEHAGQTLGLPSLFPIIFRPDPILDIVHLHFVLFSIQYASAKAWLDAGLRVERIVGHSFGQLTALSVAGSLSIRDGIRLVSERAHLIQSSWGSESGVMLAVEGTEMAVQRLLEHTDHGTDIVCYNGPDQLVLGGTEESILAVEDAIAANKSADNLRARRLDNSHAFHSRLVDSIVPELAEVAESFEFRPPAIPIESCSATGDWSTVTPAKIVEHSRMPVYFQRAVERIAHQLQAPAVWLEAGSASPIIPMVRRILGNSSDLHEYHKLDLGGRHAAGNLATVTSGLWRQGVHVQFWPFHRSQREAFGWVNLPPYQFAKNSHWVSYEPAAFSSHDISTDNEAESLKQTGLLSQLSDGPDEYLFAVNTQDPLYRTCTQGHAVLDQTLCPASMYMELALRAAGCVNPPGSLSSAIMSHIEDLLISSPLVLDPQEPVFVRLSPEGSDPSSPWSFSVFSGNKIGGDTTTHAKGTVCLLGERSRPLARFLSLGRLLDPARGRAIEEGPASSGLKGSTVYDALRRVTNYADYYRGVRQVFASGSEATGLVSILSSATETTCNPILLDNFLQIAGIHVNCLSGREEEEVFVCNAIGETFISSSLVNGEDKASQSTWKVYTSYSRLSKKEIMCDIYVIDIRTDILTAALMGVGFMSVSIRSLGRTLAKLNNITLRDANSISIPSLLPRTEAKEDATVNNEAGGEDGIDEGLISVQTMLRDLFGVGLDELSPTSSLVDIGVDSLMSTEVLAEIKKRFQINISYSTLVEITDIQGLAQHIFPGSRQVVRPSAAVGTVSRDLGAPKAAVTLPVVTDDAISLFSVALASFEETRTSVSHTYDAHWADFFHVVYPQQMTLITAYVIEAFRALGTPLESYEAGEVVPLVSVLPRHEQLRKHLYRILESVNLVRQTSRGQFVRTAISIPLVSSCTIHEQIRYEHPSYALEHDLLRITGPRLADCLTGRADGVSLIFQNAQTRSLVGDVYTQSPVFRSGNLYLVRYLTDLMKSLGNNRPIKVLEIGAGTGGTTKDLLEQFSLLPGTKERLEYTFTDISPSLVAAARKKFAKYDFVRYETLDVENKPPATHHGQYDIVLSTNCVHATRNLVKSCSNIHTLLQPNGILCLVELTRDIFWLDLVFGLLEGWWLFDDGREHALASERLWDQTLRQAGFQWIGWTDNETIESNALRVIVASPSKVSAPALSPELAKKETVTWENRDGLKLLADIFHPDELDSEERQRPIGKCSVNLCF